MPSRICIIQGHPDPRGDHFGHALAAAYAEGAAAGHDVSRIEIAELDLPCLRSREEWLQGERSEAILAAQGHIRDADHLVILFPLWLGDMPALLKAFLEQVMRPGFAIPEGAATLNAGLLKGRSARIIVTMGMPAPVYRWFFGGYAVRLLRRNILHFVGIRPVRTSIIGMVEGHARHRERWLEKARQLGHAAR